MIHKPVLLEEVLRFLNPQSNQNFIDATLGEGGHARAILEKTSPKGILLGIDKDIEQIERANIELKQFGERFITACDSFSRVQLISQKVKKISWHGILFDLGWSQTHIDVSGRGFSFARDEKLDMRYDTKLKVKSLKLKILTAREIVNEWPKEKIEQILKEYGEERFAMRIAQGIVDARKQKKIETTFQLVDIIKNATPLWYGRRRIHPATKTFQALRIRVNDEYKELEEGIRGAMNSIAKKGIIAVISFHSGEDRIVKHLFLEYSRYKKQNAGSIITKKPICASIEEMRANPRSRSAKFRVFQLANILDTLSPNTLL